MIKPGMMQFHVNKKLADRGCEDSEVCLSFGSLKKSKKSDFRHSEGAVPLKTGNRNPEKFENKMMPPVLYVTVCKSMLACHRCH